MSLVMVAWKAADSKDLRSLCVDVEDVEVIIIIIIFAFVSRRNVVTSEAAPVTV